MNLFNGASFVEYIVSALITITFFLVVAVITHKKLKKINMVEALKGYE